MKMMIISSFVETGGWGTPLIPGGGNKETGVLEETIKVELDPVVSSMVGEATITPREAIREAGSASFPSHFTTICNRPIYHILCACLRSKRIKS